MLEWAYSGVNQSVPRNAGPECANFLNPSWRNVETVIILLFGYAITAWGYSNMSLKSRYVHHVFGTSTTKQARDRTIKKALLMLMSLIWGMEIGYKFSSRTVIYLLNPCHITTAIQIYLLAAAPSDLVTAVFRVHINFLNGPLLAFIFPETDSRILPLEAAIYWIQHGMMIVVPYYLLQIGGVYHMEKYNDLSWNAFSFGLNLAYHFIILQTIAIPSQVNLNHMLCPAILDPFSGPYYRTMAILHQILLCPLICKLFCYLSYCLIDMTNGSIASSTIKVNNGLKKSAIQNNSFGDCNQTSMHGSANGHSHTE